MFSKKVRFMMVFCIIACEIIISTGLQPYIETDYCEFSCKSGKHIICLRKKQCKGSTHCIDLGENYEFRKFIMHEHNSFRNVVAGGKHYKYGNRGARNMHVVMYDMELEYICNCWTNTCRRSRDQCGASKRYKYVDTTSKYSSEFYGTANLDPDDAVINLYDDMTVQNYVNDVSWITSYRKSEFMGDTLEGHNNARIFLMLVRAETKYMGCSRSKHKDLGHVYIQCCFGLEEEPLGKPVYDMASNSSDVGSGCQERNKRYKNLCGRYAPVPKDSSWLKSGSWNCIHSILIYTSFVSFYL